MSRHWSSRREWDESDIRFRPNKRGSRPRTKDTPEHPDAELGRVVTVDRGRYTVRMHQGEDASSSGAESRAPLEERVVLGVRAKALRRTPVVPGDVVALVGDTSGEEGTLARLVRIEERSTLLRRSADDTDDAERVVVANADQLLIVVAAADPAPRTGFIDRALVAAYHADIDPILLVTKADLAEDPEDPAGLISHYAELSLATVVSGHAEEDGQLEAGVPAPGLDPAAVTRLRGLLCGHVTAMIGHSGVGKSTMVNALTGADRAIGGVNAVTGRGRHTSSSAVALNLEPSSEPGSPLDEAAARDSWIIDTPGVRSFGLAHVDPDDVLAAFGDLVEGSTGCEPGCAHAAPEGGCALDSWVEDGHAGEHGPSRLASLRGLLSSLTGSAEEQDEKRLGLSP
ncbi:ribosome small subunit-dependent GTPase A [Nesterenkonia xinjiangensis]|uniref:Ribosome biogenesis GTPase n=1 Tax=Nesterenkonia xinjiangensis TaxID=225327 RepID=A0A7Z0KBE1_9MICC|nr:GTPase RsgA [Nesterenkonia xinjiangensis]NYJ79205.1 ribosome biogenesis GTPase [Nesterenkonia xinjiangensis]